MEKYLVIHKFKDFEDNDFIYRVNDIYPREGLEPTKARIKQLTTKKNKIGKVLIKEIEVKEETASDEITETKEVKEETAEGETTETVEE